jgi:hypothetical protein
MRLDQRANVVALGHKRQPGKRTGHRDTRGECRIFVYRKRFLMAGDRQHALLGLRQHRTALAQLVEIGIRIRDQGGVGEEVDRFEITRHTCNLGGNKC